MIKREYKKVKLSDLKSYERNNKKHSANVDEIVKSIQANTYIAPIIINDDYTILAWHGRKLALDKLGTKEAEVLIVSWLSKKQERDFRLRDNKLTELSERDFENIQFELDEIGDDELTDLFSDDLGSKDDWWNEQGEENDDSVSTNPQYDDNIMNFNENYIFKSTNKYDIPQLRSDMFCDVIPKNTINTSSDDDLLTWDCNLVIYRNCSIENIRGNILWFYVDDYKFENVRTNSVKFINDVKDNQPMWLMTPNFSIWYDTPIAYQIMARYKTQRCWRYRQEAGIKIIPTLNRWDNRSFEFCFLWLPMDIPLVSVQCRNHSNKKEWQLFFDWLSYAKRVTNFQKVLIYWWYEKREFLEENMPEWIERIWLYSRATKKTMQKSK